MIEDNLELLHAMATQVKMMGHEVRFAIHPVAALDIAGKFRPHFVLLGELGRGLESEPSLDGARFIPISAQLLDPAAIEALLGADESFAS